ncbi:hypothetical protein CR513_47128, partial [Mucuna pruriens]
MAHKRHRFVVNPLISMKYASETDRDLDIATDDYQHWTTFEMDMFSLSLLLVPLLFAHDNNVYFKFHSNCCFVKSHVSKQVLREGSIGFDGLYTFKNIPLHDNISSNHSLPYLITVNNTMIPASINSTTFCTWHNRFSHAQYSAVKAVLEMCNVPFHNKTILDFCIACCLGKAHRIHAPSSTIVYNHAFEIVSVMSGVHHPIYRLMATHILSHLLMHTLGTPGFIFSNTNLRHLQLSNYF